MPIKLTIIAKKPDGVHQLELQAAAQARGVDAPIKNVSRADFANGKMAKRLNGAIIWRSSNLDILSERAALLPLVENKTIASSGVFYYPMLRFKYFQQQMMASEKATASWSIPTYRFKTRSGLQKAIDAGDLSFPIIAKPNAGAEGKGIRVLHSADDIATINKPTDYVFQAFIPNDCDWRVIVVGGSALGFLRRQAADGSFLNNISQGAKASEETDQALRNELGKIATKVASLFRLSFCGVDIIRDRETGKLYVLEVNTAPQWGDEFGFKSVTGIDVPGHVVDWVVAKETVDEHPLVDAVEQYYIDRFSSLQTDAFHFASRLWLWGHGAWARQQLDELQDSFIGSTPEQIDETISQMIETAKSKPVSVNQNKPHRKKAFAKHSELPLYNALLFKTVFCDSVYDLDIRPYIRKHIDDKAFLKTFDQLVNDPDSVRLLSTHAINYFYLLKNYFKDKLGLSSAVLVSPYELLDLLPGYEQLEQAGVIDRPTSVKLQIYLLTHAIIGESKFYACEVKGAGFRRLCAKIERLIADNYYDVSLDNKFEFLVCAELCGYKATIRSLICQEAKQSLSWAGNFLVDTHTVFGDNKVRHCMRTSEHRNVLYIMSQRPFVQRLTVSTEGTAKPKPGLIGRLAHISLPNYGVRRAVARVDSGATRSAVSASNVYVDDKGLHFTLFDPASHLYTGEEHVVSDYEQITVKNTTAKQDRYAVRLDVVVNYKTYQVMCTLADRRHMLYPVLLGRNFLTGNYTVDTSRQFVRPKRILKEQS